ncbi:MAG: hypothetical protein DHS20C21_05660 [Gemmatimonadota bacterium]|nr:MAG: hypothetical protein DHS20C21_05660 [Gemmatimonadota bacterium]
MNRSKINAEARALGVGWLPLGRTLALLAIAGACSVAAAGGIGGHEEVLAEWVSWSPVEGALSEIDVDQYRARALALLGVDDTAVLRPEAGEFGDHVPFGEDGAARCIMLSAQSCQIKAPEGVIRRDGPESVERRIFDGWLNLSVVFNADTDRVLAIVAINPDRVPKGADPTRPMVASEVLFEPYHGSAFESSAGDILAAVWELFENPASAAEVVLRPRLVTGAWDPESENGRNASPLLCWVATVRGAPRTSGQAQDMGSFWGLFVDKDARFLQGGFLR